MDLISVIVPVYNNSTTIQQSLDSIVQQDYRPLQVIVVDDGSDDDSYAFAKAYSSKNTTANLEILVSHNPLNMGAGATRNKALNKASGRYIAFLDADDLWKPNKLTKQVRALETSGRHVCYGAYEIFKTDPKNPIGVQQVFEQLDYKRLHKSNYVGNLTGLYDSSIAGKVPIAAMRKRQDWAMWLDVLKIVGPAIGVQEPIASYRLGAGLSASKLDLIKYNFAVYHEHLGYNFLKSCWCMMLFFYEQFFVKHKLKRTI